MELSAYELERQQNILQNNARLKELGLDAPIAPSVPIRRPPAKRRAPLPAVPIEGVRRSTRQRSVVMPYSDETPLPQSQPAKPAPRTLPYEAPDDDTPFEGHDDDDDDPDVPATPTERPPPEVGTARSRRVDVDKVVDAYLGQSVPGPPTKLSVVTAIAGNTRFSKYSGSLEFKNAVVLWVNIGGNDYRNVFMDGGKRMTWYASPRNDERTPVVQRLLSRQEPVLLFCRLPGEPYVCCGRLAYSTHVPRRQPLKFEWELADLPKLAKSDVFQELIGYA
jgi:hypothetical protein